MTILRYRDILWVLMLSCLVSAGLIFKTFASDLNIEVVYPKEDATIYANSTFFIGNTKPGATLTINGKPAKVYDNGAFVRVFDLQKGTHTYTLKATLNGEQATKKIKISTPAPQKTIPHKPLKIDETTINPKGDIYYKHGDVLTVKFRGSTGYDAYFFIGKKRVPMKELSVSQAGVGGVYVGKYVIQENDDFRNDNLAVRLRTRYTKLTKETQTKISVIPKEKYILAEVTSEKAPVRTFPYGGRLTPIPKGTIIAVTGKYKNHYRFDEGDIKQVWVKETDVKLLESTVELPESKVKNIELIRGEESIMFKIPLEARLPIQLREKNCALVLDIYGAESDVSTIDYAGEEFVKTVKWTQPYNKVFRMTAKLNTPVMWGYDYFYLGNDLVIKVNKPPKVDPAHPLKGKTIAIDPGHGGEELGAVGPTGVPEKEVNMKISKYLKKYLEQAGAKVVMTMTEDKDLGLYERPDIAKRHDADVLVSVHNNALPDGKNPYKTHGASVYYYHQQAQPLAQAIQRKLVSNLGFKDLGVFWGSLVLTRPMEMVSVLVEVGFMINPFEYEKLITPEYQKKSARAIKEGIENYFLEYGNKKCPN